MRWCTIQTVKGIAYEMRKDSTVEMVGDTGRYQHGLYYRMAAFCVYDSALLCTLRQLDTTLTLQNTRLQMFNIERIGK